MKNICIGLPVLLMLSFFTPSASAQTPAPVCGTHEGLAKQLNQRYQEKVTDMAVTTLGGLLEVFQSPGGKTWTIMATVPNGPSCLVSAGQDWARDKLPAKGEMGS